MQPKKLRVSLVVPVLVLVLFVMPFISMSHSGQTPSAVIRQDDASFLQADDVSQGDLSGALDESLDNTFSLFSRPSPTPFFDEPLPEEEAIPSEEPTESAEPADSIPQIRSDLPYMIVIYIGSQRVVVYSKDESGAFTVPVRVFTVSTGRGNNTIRGTYRIQSRWRWLRMHGLYAQYVTQWSGNYLFHSATYSRQDPSTLDRNAYGRLGSKASAGCIRMTVRDAKWIYDNCARGTYVVSTNLSVPADTPGSLGVLKITLNLNWDPTDPDPRNPYLSPATPSPSPEVSPDQDDPEVSPEPDATPAPEDPEVSPEPDVTPEPTPEVSPEPEAPTPTPTPTPTPEAPSGE